MKNEKELERIKNKELLRSMYVLAFTTLAFYISLLLLAVITLEKGVLLGTIICASTIVTVVVFFYAFKLEVDAGYYECRNCHHRFTTSYKKALLAPHMATTRHLRCPKCDKKTWAKKVLTK